MSTPPSAPPPARSNLLAIFLGVFAGISFVGLAAVLAMSWFLNKSFDALMTQMFSDTGSFFVLDPGDFEEIEPEGDDVVVEYD
ncbi:MAG: hypothetical protein ACK4YP_02250 [Myxococcota bacterium]